MRITNYMTIPSPPVSIRGKLVKEWLGQNSAAPFLLKTPPHISKIFIGKKYKRTLEIGENIGTDSGQKIIHWRMELWDKEGEWVRTKKGS